MTDRPIGADIKEAESLLEEAKTASVGKKILFFNSSPDYGAASELYNRAGIAFKGCKEWRQAGDAFQSAAHMDVKAGEVDESARKLLSAASCYKKCDPALAVATIEAALEILLRAGRFHLVAAHEKEIAELYEGPLENPREAVKYYQRAAERYAGEDSLSMAQSCLIKVATITALLGDFDTAARIFEEAASESVSDTLRKYSVRDFLLKAGLCRLNGRDRIAVRRAIETYPTIDVTFASTREYKFLTDLSEVTEGGDVEGFTDLVAAFDRTSALDDWKTKVLLRLKESINEDDGLL